MRFGEDEVQGSGADFSACAALLGTDRSIYAPDLPGSGGSDAPKGRLAAAGLALAVVDLVENLRLKRVDLVGCGRGALVAFELANTRPQEIRRVVEVDLTAHLICNREAVRRMSRSRGGRGGSIVNISSRASELFGAGGFIPYGAAKGGIDVLTKGLGKEVAGEGIRVNGLRPGLIDTDIQVDTGIENRIERFGATVPIGRAGTTDEVAEAVLWLLSEASGYVAGTVFDVSGGR